MNRFSKELPDDMYIGTMLNIKDYKYSSYVEYISNSWIIDTDFVFDMISKKEFERYNIKITQTAAEKSAACLICLK